MTLLLSDVDVRRAMDYTDLADSIEAALKVQAAESAVVPARMNLEHLGTWLRVMPAIVPSANAMGLKVFHGVPGGGARYLILLFAVNDGSILAAVDANYLTAARTAATSAVASRYMTPDGSVRLGVIGSGMEAETHCLALCAVGNVSAIKVFSPNEVRREAFAERMRFALGLPVAVCGRPEDTVADVGHVVVATNTGPAMTVACRTEWLSAGQHVTSIGSTNQRLRELDTEIFRRADVIVLDANPEQMAEESGDLIQYVAEGGVLDPARMQTLPDLIAAQGPAREHDDQLTLYKSVGTALQDVVAADLVYRRCRELGLGTEVPDLGQEKRFAGSSPVVRARESVPAGE